MVVEKGPIKGVFRGYRPNTKFIFENGSTWIQVQKTYEYYFLNKAFAQVVERYGMFYLEISGMNSTVRVRKVETT